MLRQLPVSGRDNGYLSYSLHGQSVTLALGILLGEEVMLTCMEAPQCWAVP